MPPEIEADPVETPAEEAIVEIPAEKPETKEVTPAAEERIEKIVQGIKDKLDAPAKKDGPTPEQIKAAWIEQVKKETNMSDAQIEYMENRLAAVVAPIYADNVYNEWKQEKVAAGVEIDAEVEKGVKEYLGKYDPRVRQDKTLLDNVLFMEIGKRVVAKKPAPKVETKVEEPVIGRPKIVPNSPAPAQSLASGIRKPGGAVALTPEEKMMARKMHISEADYAAAKETAVISDLRKK